VLLRLKVCVFLFACIFLFTNCGKKTDPVPPKPKNFHNITISQEVIFALF